MAKLNKKKRARSLPKTGLSGVPFDKGLRSTLDYFHMDVDRKIVSEVLKTWVKNTYSKSDAKAILAQPEWKFSTYTHYGCIAYWKNTKQDIWCNKLDQPQIDRYSESLTKYFNEMIEPGKVLLKEKQLKAKENANLIVLSPQQRLQKKIGDTIIQDMLELEDEWIEGKETSLDLYNRFKFHGLSGSATLPVRAMIEGWLLDYEDAYFKRCEQAVEGYSHLKKSELNRRINVCHSMLNDLDRIKLATKATRKVKIKKPVTADKQVAKVKYMKEDTNYKLVSINPINIIGNIRLYTFNTKKRILSEYVTMDPKGFVIKGTTKQNFDKDQSRQVKLRKPDILQSVLKDRPTVVSKNWNETIKTKSSLPNGRLNEDTILLRVHNK